MLHRIHEMPCVHCSFGHQEPQCGARVFVCVCVYHEHRDALTKCSTRCLVLQHSKYCSTSCGASHVHMHVVCAMWPCRASWMVLSRQGGGQTQEAFVLCGEITTGHIEAKLAGYTGNTQPSSAAQGFCLGKAPDICLSATHRPVLLVEQLT